MAKHLIEKLLAYGVTYLYLNKDDIIFTRNTLLHLLKVETPSESSLDFNSIKNLDVPDTLINELDIYLKEKLQLDDFRREQVIEEVMGTITPLPSFVNKRFDEIYKKSSLEAVQFLYDLNVKSNYVQKSKIAQNIKWTSPSGIEVSINLSKPEKDNKQIKKAALASASNYPKCVICLENAGYYGRPNHSIRRTLRTVPLNLNDEGWFLQYSPFGYYDEHLIVITNEHKPMAVNENYTKALFAFLDLFPFYFIGANSDLPITGGSILSHEHFQGGRYTFPLMKAEPLFQVNLKKYEDVVVTFLNFYNTTFSFVSKNKEQIINLALSFNAAWQNFDDLESEILSHSNNERHSSLTMIAKKEGELYQLFLILRNNRTNEEHPGGIFHAHQKYHHIKREGIGLIEAMGLFILPARLKRQSLLIEKIIKENLAKEDYLKLDPELILFEEMIEDLRNEKEDLAKKIQDYISNVCESILYNTAVFKNDDEGMKALFRFLEYLENYL